MGSSTRPPLDSHRWHLRAPAVPHERKRGVPHERYQSGGTFTAVHLSTLIDDRLGALVCELGKVTRGPLCFHSEAAVFALGCFLAELRLALLHTQ